MFETLDVKGRALTQHVPYILVTSPAQFLGLVPGRRKAIEVGSFMIKTM